MPDVTDVPACSEPGCTNPRKRLGVSRRGFRVRCSRHERLRYPEDPAKVKARQRKKTHIRKARTRYADFTPAQERELRRKAKRCPLCRVRMVDEPYLPASKELDHMVPLNVGGTHTLGNVRIICRACNIRRPKDGSDYTGPVTLWAQEPGMALGPRVKGRCRSCGSKKAGNRCPTCRPLKNKSRVEDGPKAAQLRLTGMTWQAIADALGFTCPAGAYTAARTYGDPDVVAAWPDIPRRPRTAVRYPT